LLKENPDYERRDTVLYQLSKAYDLRGDAERSAQLLDQLRRSSNGSKYVTEAEFRLAERHFANADYVAAEASYRSVLQRSEESAFYTRSLYMLGWSQFKLARYEEALAAFLASLDALLPVPGEKQGASLDPLHSMSRSQRELVDDCLRVMALSYDNLGGVDHIARSLSDAPERHYRHQLYRALGSLYQEKERFSDSAAVYIDFMRRNPESFYTHEFALLAISAFESGDFPQQILMAKREYVDRFGTHNTYWSESSEQVRDTISENLRPYLQQLASHYHALGQQLRAEAQAQQANAAPGPARDHLLVAVTYYQQFIDSFPQDPAVPKTLFHMAEGLYEAGQLPRAIGAYAQMAYSFVDDPQAADAGYMTVQLSRELLAETQPEEAVQGEAANAIQVSLRFANTFVEDPRAQVVMGDAARQLLEAGQFQEAAQVAMQMLGSPSQLDSELALSTSLVLGHAQFALDEFAAAEAAYMRSLVNMPENDSRRSDTELRIAASLYRQAQIRREQGDVLEAAHLFGRATSAAPSSDIGVTALHDAAVAYREGGQLQRAVTLFGQLRSTHPKHSLSAGIGATLLGLYEHLKDWQNAAVELDELARTDAQPEARRQSLLLAAQYYDKAEAQDLAIDRYRQYAHAWEQPLGPRMEAMNRLGELYGEAGAIEKRDFWLRKIESAYRQEESDHSARIAYLAAQACGVLAQSPLGQYRAARLTLPLKVSLKRKRSTMDAALAAYTRCSGYGVESVTTESGYRIGKIYEQFSESLLQSERPRSLDTLALEQYELMLEEQAFPFEEKAIAVHETNIKRCWEQGVYDQWIKASFTALASLVPAQYRKSEWTTLSADVVPASLTRKKNRRVHSLNKDAIAHRNEGDFEGARNRYQEALEVAEDAPLIHRNLGILYELYLGQPRTALVHYRRYADLTDGSDRIVAGWIAQLQRRVLSVAGEV